MTDLETLRKRLGLTQPQFAHALGCTMSQYGAFIGKRGEGSGRRRLPLSIEQQVCVAAFERLLEVAVVGRLNRT